MRSLRLQVVELARYRTHNHLEHSSVDYLMASLSRTILELAGIAIRSPVNSFWKDMSHNVLLYSTLVLPIIINQRHSDLLGFNDQVDVLRPLYRSPTI